MPGNHHLRSSVTGLSSGNTHMQIGRACYVRAGIGVPSEYDANYPPEEHIDKVARQTNALLWLGKFG